MSDTDRNEPMEAEDHTSAHPTYNQPYNQHDIENLAYQLWEERGQPEGGDQQDWFTAESILEEKH